MIFGRLFVSFLVLLNSCVAFCDGELPLDFFPQTKSQQAKPQADNITQKDSRIPKWRQNYVLFGQSVADISGGLAMSYLTIGSKAVRGNNYYGLQYQTSSKDNQKINNYMFQLGRKTDNGYDLEPFGQISFGASNWFSYQDNGDVSCYQGTMTAIAFGAEFAKKSPISFSVGYEFQSITTNNPKQNKINGSIIFFGASLNLL